MAILHLQLTGNNSTHTLLHDIKNQKLTLRKVVVQKNGTSHTFGGGVYLNFSRSICSAYEVQSPSAHNGMFFVPLTAGVSGMQTHDFHVSFKGLDMTQIIIDTVNDDATTPATFGAAGLKQIDLYLEYAENMHFH